MQAVNAQQLVIGLKFCIAWAAAFLLLTAEIATAQTVLRVAAPAWASLSQPEKDTIQKSYLVESVGLTSFGTVIDNQGVNESTSGTNGGAALGQALANASYVDTAIRGGNYSAKTQLGAILLGGLLGSTIDSKGTQRFHQRYAVKLGDGSIQYFDEVNSDPFRHPVGVCVTVPNVAISPDQQLCSQTVADLRVKLLGQPSLAVPTLTIAAPDLNQTNSGGTPSHAGPVVSDSTELVNCKLNSLAPVRTTAEKCSLINGRSVQ
nr:hypothetical protein [Rhodoferax sp.]